MRKVNLVGKIDAKELNGELEVYVVGRHKDRVDIEDASIEENGKVQILMRADDDADWSKIASGMRYRLTLGDVQVAKGVVTDLCVLDSR